MKTLKSFSIVVIAAALLAGCGLLPEKSPTRLEKSPCACGETVEQHV